MQTSDSIVIIPTYNERENIENIIRAVFALEKVFHILIIEDGSPDGTASIVKTLQQEFPERLFMIERKGKLGLGTAYIAGFKWSLEHDYEYIFEMDADFSHNPADLPRLYKACAEEGADVAIGSRYISGFKAGTQKIEMIVKERFPQARVLRMDMDTTRNKEGYEQILSAFANQEADILIGTQMIVKGHDFPNVTLVGVLAADLSLYVSDYHAAERTFQLLTQAAGRAGRGSEPGEVVIQTYRPDHYSVQTAKEQDYEAFYEQEMEYRRMLLYPPVWNMLVILCASKQEQTAYDSAKLLVQEIDTWQENIKAAMERVGEDFKKKRVFPVGPADPAVAKVNDIYKKVIYIKTKDYQTLVELKDRLEHYMRDNKAFKDTVVQFDFNPMSGF